MHEFTLPYQQEAGVLCCRGNEEWFETTHLMRRMKLGYRVAENYRRNKILYRTVPYHTVPYLVTLQTDTVCRQLFEKQKYHGVLAFW